MGVAAQQELQDAKTHARLRLARACRRKNGSPDEATEARRDYAAIKIEQAIVDALETAPPLTDAQRARLADLLASRQGGGSA